MSNLVSFTPLMRQSIGFDRFNDLFETLLNESEARAESYPPYNIEKLDENSYLIEIALAGFSENDLDITVHDDTLKVSARMESRTEDEGREYLHRGIATRAFERTFRLADYIEVDHAQFRDGMLSIKLVRNVPEEKQPRMIPINGKSKGLLGKKKAN